MRSISVFNEKPKEYEFLHKVDFFAKPFLKIMTRYIFHMRINFILSATKTLSMETLNMYMKHKSFVRHCTILHSTKIMNFAEKNGLLFIGMSQDDVKSKLEDWKVSPLVEHPKNLPLLVKSYHGLVCIYCWLFSK